MHKPPQDIYRYNIDRIRFLIDENGFTQREVALACRCSERHLNDVLNNRVATARGYMRKRFKDGFRSLLGEQDLDNLFY